MRGGRKTRLIYSLLSLLLFLEWVWGAMIPRGQAALLGSFQVHSDYVWRGLTQTGHSPAVQGRFDYKTQEGVYLGTWVSNVLEGGVEQDVYGVYAFHWEETQLTLGGTWYNYPLKTHKNATELFARGEWKNWEGGLYYTPQYFAFETASWYGNLRWYIPLTSSSQSIKWLVGAGYTQFIQKQKAPYRDYFHGETGLMQKWGDFELSLTYSDTNRKAVVAGKEILQQDLALYFSLAKYFSEE